MGFVEASRTGGVLILTHRRNLVDQFHGELRDRGYAERVTPALLDDDGDATRADGPVTVETYQWFVRNAGRISDAYTIVICDEAHTALGEKTSAAIRAWTGPIFIGMTATGALIARHVTDLFPTQTSRFDLAQAARRGVIAPLRCIRIPPGPGVRTIAKVPLRRGEVDVEFDQEMLAELLDQLPFNMAIADLYKTRFNGVPGVIYAAGVRHAYNVAEAFRELGIKAEAVSGETPKRELAEILAAATSAATSTCSSTRSCSPRAGTRRARRSACTSRRPRRKRIYQQRVGRVTRRHPGKEAGVVVDFVHPATKHDDPVVTLHSLLDRDVYRGGAIVVGPVRRGRGRRVRVERRVIPVTADEDRRHEVFERELWRIAVEHLDYGEQHMWAALAGARVAPSGWRRARAMLHFDRTGELKRRFLLTAVERNRNSQLRLRALQEIAAAKDAEAFDLVDRRHRDVAARGAPRGRQGHAAGAGREAHRPPRPGQRVDLAPRRVHARGPRGVRGPALAGDQAAARPARELERRRARAQRAAARPRGAQAGPPAVGRAARRRGRAHAGGRGGPARRAHAHGAQAERALARAAAQLPEGQGPALAPPPQEGGDGVRGGRRHGGGRAAGDRDGGRRRRGRRGARRGRGHRGDDAGRGRRGGLRRRGERARSRRRRPSGGGLEPRARRRRRCRGRGAGGVVGAGRGRAEAAHPPPPNGPDGRVRQRWPAAGRRPRAPTRSGGEPAAAERPTPRRRRRRADRRRPRWTARTCRSRRAAAADEVRSRCAAAVAALPPTLRRPRRRRPSGRMRRVRRDARGEAQAGPAPPQADRGGDGRDRERGRRCGRGGGARHGGRRGARRPTCAPAEASGGEAADASVEGAQAAPDEKPKPRRRRKPAEPPAGEAAPTDAAPPAEEAPKPPRRRTTTRKPVADSAPESAAPAASETATDTDAASSEDGAPEPPKPRRRRAAPKKATPEDSPGAEAA